MTLLVVKAATTQARSIAAAAPGVPEGVAHIVDHALALGKASRWVSAVAMRDAIRDTYVGLYGEAISRAPLVSLLEEHQRSPTVTEASPPVPPPVPEDLRTSSLLVSAIPDKTTVTPAGEGPTGSVVGMITSKPVSSDSLEAPLGVPSRKRPTRAVLGAVAIGVAIGIIALASLELGERLRPTATAASPTAESSQTAAAGGSAAPSPTGADVSPVTSASTEPSSTPPPPTITAAATGHGSPRLTPPAPLGGSRPAPPCKLVKTIDKEGEPHFSCPCAICP
jgi:hypothetical protein